MSVKSIAPAELTPVASASGALRPMPKPKPKPIVRQPVPPELADVALIDAPRIAAAACIGQSHLWELVKSGRAPQPVLRAPRCTRWRMADIRAWLIERAANGSDPQASEAAQSAAGKASAAAQAKRKGVTARLEA